MSNYVLYGTEHSYFTGKLRPYLRFKKIPYEERQVTLWTYQRFIVPRTGVRYIPVLQTPDDEVLQDTSVIMDELEKRFPDRPILPTTPRQRLVALLLEVYADEWFLLPGMHYRWSYLKHHEKYLMDEFGKLAGSLLPGPLRRTLARKISKPFKGSLKFLGVTPKSIPAIEAWFENFLSDFERHLAHHEYLLGSRPCLADFALAGPLGAHILRDPYSRKLLQDRAPGTLDWLERINAYEQDEGEFLQGDAVPATLLPILQHMLVEQWPILEATAMQLPKWVAEHPEKQEVSRALGWHEFRVGDVTERRLMFSNALWMMQRPLDYFHSLSDADQAAVNDLLAQCDGEQAMQFKMPLRVARLNNRVVLES